MTSFCSIHINSDFINTVKYEVCVYMCIYIYIYHPCTDRYIRAGSQAKRMNYWGLFGGKLINCNDFVLSLKEQGDTLYKAKKRRI